MELQIALQIRKKGAASRTTILAKHTNRFPTRNDVLKKDKLFISGYKTYRADAEIRRKGTIILISDELDCLAYKTIQDEENGRYLQIKLKAINKPGEIIFNNIYLEPSNKDKNTIPQEIWDSEHIIGDLNKLETGYEKQGVYHFKNMGKIIQTIEIPKKI